MERIKKYYEQHPLRAILILAVFFRLVAAIFSKGFGMHDDHFLVIEPAGSWVDGTDATNWLPWSPKAEPDVHNMFYPGIHFLLFSFLKIFGLTDPQVNMYFVRLMHAFFSSLAVFYIYKLSFRLTRDTRVTNTISMLVALYWFMPLLSVRNLSEVFCMAPLVAAFYYLQLFTEKRNIKHILLSGILLGVAMGIRYQVFLFPVGVALFLTYKKEFKTLLLLGFFAVISFSITQAGDLVLWHRPFVALQEYIKYNIANANNYLTNGWYAYLLVIAGILIPPVSLFLWFGYFRSFRKFLIIALPAFVFFAFHSYFPNKQERFIMPFIPFFIIVGLAGWDEFRNGSGFWQRNRKLYKGCILFFWSLNLLFLILVSPQYTKKSRVESMYYLRSLNDVKSFIIESSNNNGVEMPPRYYYGKWEIENISINKTTSLDAVKHDVEIMGDHKPNYIFFCEDENKEKRMSNIVNTLHCKLTKIKDFEPSLLDNVFYILNPKHNINQRIELYTIEYL